MLHKKSLLFIVFLTFNFLALYIGVLLMNNGPRTEWYMSLNKAPWTPPSWMFGAAWTTIMLLFAAYMVRLAKVYPLYDKKMIVLYGIQWVLNVGWNLAFFNKKNPDIGFIVIVVLWLLIGYFTLRFKSKMRYATLFIIPYLIWMTIATSLNGYIVIFN